MAHYGLRINELSAGAGRRQCFARFRPVHAELTYPVIRRCGQLVRVAGLSTARSSDNSLMALPVNAP